jgi:CheY-like chemotaxis protein
MQMKHNVMLVDDDYITNVINSTIFEHLESVNQVSSFTNPVLALQYICRHCVGASTACSPEPLPDLLVVDLKMVPIDGFDFITELKRCTGEAFRKISISILTTSSHPQDQQKIDALSLATYLTKPLTEQKAKQLLALSTATKTQLSLS